MNSIEFSFFIDNDTFKRLTFFSVLDILMFIVWLLLILAYAFFKKSQRSELEYYGFYFKNLFFKMFFGVFFSLFYIFYYDGGDTTGYWDLGSCMNNLFWESPRLYFNNLFYDLHDPEFINKYDLKTGYPPAWIMSEHAGFFTGKIVSLFCFVTGSSYLTITLLFATIIANVTWRFYEMVRLWIPEPSKLLIYSVLFIPSVAFWCSGITKDTIVLIAILSIVTHVFRLLHGKRKRWIWDLIVIIFHFWILINIRSAIVMVLIIPFFIAFSSRISNRFHDFIYFKRFIQLFVATISLVGFFAVVQSGKDYSLDTYIKEAEIIQKDFAYNSTYQGKKYSIEVSEYSVIGVIQAMPAAVLAGLFRPFLWESFTATLFLNGIESITFMYLLVLLFTKKVRERLRFIRRNEFLMFCLFFVLIYGLITGFSSIIFGVLVRLRAPLLPFLGILLTAYLKPKPKTEEEIAILEQKNQKLISR